MRHSLIVAAIIGSMALPTLAPAQGRRATGGTGNGTQQRARVHTPGTGQQTGTATQQRKRDRKRDGTGPNCTGNCPAAQQATQSQQRTEQQTETEQQTQTGNPK